MTENINVLCHFLYFDFYGSLKCLVNGGGILLCPKICLGVLRSVLVRVHRAVSRLRNGDEQDICIGISVEIHNSRVAKTVVGELKDITLELLTEAPSGQEQASSEGVARKERALVLSAHREDERANVSVLLAVEDTAVVGNVQKSDLDPVGGDNLVERWTAHGGTERS